jgi:NADP-dependent 3-hydroxy acid dehydrogenase YdfG
MELADKAALITGAGAVGGIGAEIARVLADEGAFVVVSGRDVARGEEVVKEFTAKGGQARFELADLSNLDEVTRLAGAAGSIDILVNNAAALAVGPSGDLDDNTFDQLFQVNVRATYFLTTELAPAMVAKGAGSIINISSLAGKIALPGASAYGATKAAIDSLTRSWANEWSASGVRVKRDRTRHREQRVRQRCPRLRDARDAPPGGPEQAYRHHQRDRSGGTFPGQRQVQLHHRRHHRRRWRTGYPITHRPPAPRRSA